MPRKYIAKIETDSTERRDAIESCLNEPAIQKLADVLADERLGPRARNAILDGLDHIIQEGLLQALSDAGSRKPVDKKAAG